MATAFIGIPGAGVWAYDRLVGRMERDRITDPPLSSLFALFAGYGFVAIYVFLALTLGWSGMHVLGGLLIVFGMTPYFAVQGVVMSRVASRSRYHRAVQLASFTFALPVVTLFLVALMQ